MKLALRWPDALSGSRSQMVSIAFDIDQALRRQHKEAAIDPAAIAARLLMKPVTRSPSSIERTEAAGRLHRGDRGQLAVASVEGDQLR